MKKPIAQDAQDQLFLTARTYNGWTDEPVEDALIYRLYDLMKWGPTAANSCPARFVWVRSAEAKVELAALARGPNQAKILASPVIVIVGNDLDFGDSMPKLASQERAAQVQQLLKEPGLIETMAMRNGSIQGAYLILAARALGLDCGPMSGFDNALVDQRFFKGKRIQSNFICCLGYGKTDSFHPRAPRLTFEEAGRFA